MLPLIILVCTLYTSIGTVRVLHIMLEISRKWHFLGVISHLYVVPLLDIIERTVLAGRRIFKFGKLAKITKFKTAKYCDIALCVCDQYWSSSTICFLDRFAKFSHYTV